MQIRIVYETNSGGTYLVVELVREIMAERGHAVEVQKASLVDGNYLFHDGVTILGSPSWDYTNEEGAHLEGHPHEAMYLLMKSVERRDSKQKFAVFGLGDPSYTFFCGAVDHMNKFVERVGGEFVGESLRVGEFYFDKENNMQKVREWAEGLRVE